MKRWKVIFRYDNEIKEVVLAGERYSDVYIDVLVEYPGCIIISILEI